MENKTTIIIFGASGDLAKKKTFPALFGLLQHNYLPKNVNIIGYARSDMSREEFVDRITSKIKLETDKDKELMTKFRGLVHYVKGAYDEDESYAKLKEELINLEAKTGGLMPITRIYYLALPPILFHPVAKCIKKALHNPSMVHRMIVEKPFGKDLQSSNELSEQLGSLFKEEEIYRIDHYLGKEMVKNIMVLRFANIFLSGLWNRHYIKSVQVVFKEPFGTEGRGGYFDQYGIIRDVIQNHLLQVLSVVAMERPVSLGPEDVRDEKVKVLKCIRPLSSDHLLLGQYGKSKDGSKPSYVDDKTVPKDSNCPTFAVSVLFIDNERWAGVPFMLKAGKALNEKKAEIRIQFEDVAGAIFKDCTRNELVIRVQPDEAVYLKIMQKKPGLSDDTIVSELDLSYNTRFTEAYIPDAYEALILDVLNGNSSNFVRSDELEAAWKIFTPVLHQIERENTKPEIYEYGSRGPASLDDFVKRYGYVRGEKEYNWPASPKKEHSKI